MTSGKGCGFTCTRVAVRGGWIMESWSAEVAERAIVNCAGIVDYSELRLKQAVIVQEFVSGKDVFVSPPTASGKSL